MTPQKPSPTVLLKGISRLNLGSFPTYRTSKEMGQLSFDLKAYGCVFLFLAKEA